MSDTATQTQSNISATDLQPADWTRVMELNCDLTAELALPGIKVRDLTQMESGTVLNSHWQISADMPVRVNGVLIAWSEFEVVGDHLAIRFTELA